MAQRKQFEKFMFNEKLVIPQNQARAIDKETAEKIYRVIDDNEAKFQFKNESEKLLNNQPKGKPLQEDQKPKSKNKTSRLNNFDFDQLLAKGKLGDIFLAHIKLTSSVFVMKCLSRQKMKDHQIEDQVKNALKLQSELCHPNILRLRGFLLEDTHIYMMLEYLPIGSLYGLMKQQKAGHFTNREAVKYAKSVIDGLRFLHGQNIFLRNLCSRNLMVGSDGHLKIKNLTWTIQGQNSTQAKIIIDVIDYIAPEILTGLPQTKAVDLWSLGILIFELLIGVTPFNASAKEEMIANIRTSYFYFPDDFQNELAENLILHLLKGNSSYRMSLERAAKHPWFNTS